MEKDKEKHKQKHWEAVTVAELGHRLFLHLVKHRMTEEEAWNRVATYYGLDREGRH